MRAIFVKIVRHLLSILNTQNFIAVKSQTPLFKTIQQRQFLLMTIFWEI